MKVLLTGGGTGGHAVPVLAVSQALKERGAEVLVVGSHQPAERERAEAAGVPFMAISAGKLRRYFSGHNFGDVLKVVIGFFQSLRLLRKFRPDIVFSKGGYVALPVVRAASLLGIPCVLHESDAVPGLSNRLSAKYADKVAVSFAPETIEGLPSEKLVLTGNPLRANVFKGKASQARKIFRLLPELPVLLVVGGSQGSQQINQIIWHALPKLLPAMQIIHQVGERSAKEVKLPPIPQGFRKRYQARASLENELFDAYAVADVVVTRGGIGSLSELAAAGKPMVIMPHDKGSGGSGHQRVNAQRFAERGAAVILSSETGDSTELVQTIMQLMRDSQRRANMSRAAKTLAEPRATENIVRLIEEVAKSHA